MATGHAERRKFCVSWLFKWDKLNSWRLAVAGWKIFNCVARKEWGDLRQLIDLRMRQLQGRGPRFSDQCAKKMMLDIAMGMQQLHNHGILHKDLKVSNVFVSTPYPREFPEDIEDDAFNVKVFDFETSVDTVGPGFWRPGTRNPSVMQGAQYCLQEARSVFHQIRCVCLRNDVL